MKSSEILSALPQWSGASAADILASPAWAMPCRLGETPCTMRLDAIRPADTLDLAIKLEDEQHVLSLSDSPLFADLHALWASRADVPEAILLALVEKECGPLLQAIENAARRQLSLAGIAKDSSPDASRLCARLCDGNGETMLSFAITDSPALSETLGQLRYIDTANGDLRDTALSATAEFASFAIPAADQASLAVGDALLLPEIDSAAPRLVVDGRFVADETGVAPFTDDGLLRVRAAQPVTVTLGYLFDHAASPQPISVASPSALALLKNGSTIATGHLGDIAGQKAFIVESV